MKKILSVILVLTMVCSLAACSGGSSSAKLRFVTGGEAGTYYSFGSVLA